MHIWAIAAGLLLLGWAVALSVADLRRRRLPDVLTVGGAVLIVAVAGVCGRGLPALVGAAALGGVYLAVHVTDPHALGGGDVKLAVALGGLTGALGTAVWTLAALGAPLLTAIAGAVLLIPRSAGGAARTAPRSAGGAARPTLPHGPSMCLASLAAAALAVL